MPYNNSPVVGRGNAAACAAAPVNGVDERGVARAAACVVGALEAHVAHPTLYVVPVNQTLAYHAAVPGVSFYALRYYTGSPHGTLVHPTLLVAPTCGSAYRMGTPAGSLRITCGGGSHFGRLGHDPQWVIDVSSSATLTVTRLAAPALHLTSTQGFFATPLRLSVTGALSGAVVTYTARNGTARGCAVSASRPTVLRASSTGTCVVSASEATSTNYRSTTTSATVTIWRGTPAPLVITSLVGSVSHPLALTTRGGAPGAIVTYAVVRGSASSCALLTHPARVRAGSKGTCRVTASEAVSASWRATSSASTVVVFR